MYSTGSITLTKSKIFPHSYIYLDLIENTSGRTDREIFEQKDVLWVTSICLFWTSSCTRSAVIETFRNCQICLYLKRIASLEITQKRLTPVELMIGLSYVIEITIHTGSKITTT